MVRERSMYFWRVCVGTALAILFSSQPALTLTAAQKCSLGKISATGKYGMCRMKAEMKAAKKEATANFDKCNAKLVKAFDKLEAKHGAECPTSGDVAGIIDRLAGDTSELACTFRGFSPGEPASIVIVDNLEVTASVDPTLTIRNQSMNIAVAYCFFASHDACSITDFTILLPSSSSISWPAGEGNDLAGIPSVPTIPFSGEMVCVETDFSLAPIGGNHLSSSVAQPGQCPLSGIGLLGNMNNGNSLLTLGSDYYLDEYEPCPPSIGTTRIEGCWSNSDFEFLCSY